MPSMLARPCSHPGCPNLDCQVHRGETRQQADDRRGNANERGYGRRWRLLRLMYLRAHPVCAECGAAAVDVHHIVAKRDGGTDQWANLRALCHSCHSRMTNRGEICHGQR